jgi:hypothetical protein
MKVIFMDCDGVMATKNTGWADFHPDCVKALKKILDATGAFIVLSSCWRHGFLDRSNKNVEDHFIVYQKDAIPRLKEWFVRWGLPPERLIDKTPDFHTMDINAEFPSDHRGTEISLWLDKHPEIECFVILDDSNDIEPHEQFFVQTYEPEGLTLENADQAIKILNSIPLDIHSMILYNMGRKK